MRSIAAAILLAACTTAWAQPTPPAEGQLNPTHQLRVGPTQVIFRFAERFECSAGEFLVVIADVANQSVIRGCAHLWEKIHFIRFSDGEIGAIDEGKWTTLRRPS